MIALTGRDQASPEATTAAATTATRDPPATSAHPTSTKRVRRRRSTAIPPAKPGTARVVTRGPAASKGVALTFDDGYCADCVAALVVAAQRRGAHVTFCPNGTYGSAWEPQRRRIRQMLARGQASFCNHTWSHRNLKALSEAEIAEELTRNEEWIQKTFGVTSRPFFRPPYGAYDERVLRVAGQLGFTQVVMWSGTLADSTVRTPGYLASALRGAAKPGAIILGHGNHPATPKALRVMVRDIRARGLRPLTLAELLG